MTAPALLLLIGLIVTLVMLFYSIKRNLEYQDKLDELDEVLGSVVDALDEQHAKIEAKTHIEVFSEEPIIKELVQDISTARDLVKESASILRDVAASLQEEDEETDENNDK